MCLSLYTVRDKIQKLKYYVSFDSKGAGDLNIKACVPERMLLQETYVIEDCVYSNLDELTYSHTGSPLSDNISGGKFSIPPCFEWSCDMKVSRLSSTEARIYLANSYSGTDQCKYGLWQQFYMDGANGGVRENNRTVSTVNNTVQVSANTYYNFKVVRDGNTLTYYINDTPFGTGTATWIDNYEYYVTMIQWKNCTYNIKNIKIKPL